MTTLVDESVREMPIESRICTAYPDLGRVGPYVRNIAVAYERGIEEAIRNLLSLGHRRTGFIGGSERLRSLQRRHAAFSDFTLGGGYVACSKLLTGFSPTAIAAMNDIAAVGALRCATDCGVRVHDDLSAIGFDDITAAEFSQPALTTVGIPRDRIGVPAFQALREMPDSKSHEGAEYRVTPKLAIRESRGAARTEGR